MCEAWPAYTGEMNPALLPIVRAVDYIESQLDAPLAAPAIALAAGLSVSQLHRVFRAATGETLMDYVRHRRLALAAKALCQTSRTVLDIALDHGFENHETFTRAFQRRFGMSPQQFRREGARDHFLLRRPPLEPEFLALLSQRLSQRPSLEHYPEQRLIGLSTTFYSFGHPEENALRQVEALWWQTAEHFPRFQPAALMGLIESPEYLGHGEQHRYTAGLIHEATDLPEGWPRTPFRPVAMPCSCTAIATSACR